MESKEIFLMSIFLVLVYYFLFVAKRVKMYGSNAEQLRFIQRVKSLKGIYFPTIFYCHGILQSIFGLTKRLKERLPYRREIFKLQDGGEVGLDFLDPDQSTRNENLIMVIILPGLTSSSQTSYVKTLALSCVSTGASVVIMNHRGLGGVPLKTPRLFCATNCEDIFEVFNHLKLEYPNHKRIALGTSLGGIQLTHYLFKHPEESKDFLSCALLISTIWDAHAADTSIERPLNKFFVNTALATSLKALMRKHKDAFENSEELEERLKKCNTIRQFDSCITAPNFKYSSVEDYYDDVTVSHRVKYFNIPVFALNAADDPMQPGSALPITEAQDSASKLVLIVTARGGHLGFLEGFLPTSKPLHFMERFVRDFLLEFQTDMIKCD